MARLRSTRYPELYVADLDVQFRGGVADVRAKAKVDVLLRMDGIEKDTGKDDADDAAGDQSGAGGDDGGQSGDSATGSGDPADTGSDSPVSE